MHACTHVDQPSKSIGAPIFNMFVVLSYGQLWAVQWLRVPCCRRDFGYQIKKEGLFRWYTTRCTYVRVGSFASYTVARAVEVPARMLFDIWHILEVRRKLCHKALGYAINIWRPHVFWTSCKWFAVQRSVLWFAVLPRLPESCVLCFYFIVGGLLRCAI